MMGICEWCGRLLDVEPAPVEMIHFCTEKCKELYEEMLEGLNERLQD
jgi:hypothetical protein